jgi:hypothetical protein
MTTGNPQPTAYARQARLVRSSGFLGPVVILESGATLANVWISGQRQAISYPGSDEDFNQRWTSGENIRALSGDASAVVSVRSDTPAGWSQLVAYGAASPGDPGPCSNLLVTGNLLVGYTSTHTIPFALPGCSIGKFLWSDGISMLCEDATVSYNYIVDPTDVGIVLFRALSAQQSEVHANVVLAAGLSAFAGIAYEPSVDVTSPSFGGSNVHDNAIITSPTQHFDLGIAVGSKPWSATNNTGYSGNGQPVRVSNNSSAGVPSRYRIGVSVDGMGDVEILGNSLNISAFASCPPSPDPVCGPVPCCPAAAVQRDVDDTSGTIQTPHTTISAHQCLTVLPH